MTTPDKQKAEWPDEKHIESVGQNGGTLEDEGKALMNELMALADIRQVIGDPHGKLTQGELVSEVKRLKLERDELYRDYHQVGTAWETASAMVAEPDTLAAQNSALKEWIRIARGFPKERGPYKDGYELDQAALKLLNESPATHLTEIKAQAVEEFKSELVKSVSVIYRPHIEGVCAVVINRMRQEAQCNN